MAATSSRAHLFQTLSRHRSVSPRGEDYATANSIASSFNVERDAIHSTAQLPDHTTQQQLPQWHQQPPRDYDQLSEGGSDGSADMSIELGRGVKRGAEDRDDEVSSNIVFNMGNDSFYELTGTPPLHRQKSQPRKPTDDGLRRQASIRRATETAKTKDAQKPSGSFKARSLSEALRSAHAEEETSFLEEEQQFTATFNSRNTRFTNARQASANGLAAHRLPSNTNPGTPRKAAGNNPTAQSNSFMLPDLPNIAELVSGVRKDGTPVFNRNAKSRSRFTSASYKPARPEHYPVDSVPIPDEEKAIYASLQLLKERVDQLEMEKSETLKRAEEYENEIIDLRSQLAVSQRRPDSGLGSDEDASGSEKLKKQKANLQASVKVLQDRLDRSERKAGMSDITVKRVTRERDELVKQIGVAYYSNEELKEENEAFRESHDTLQAENVELKDEVDALRRENQDLRLLVEQTQRSYDDERQRSAPAVKSCGQKVRDNTVQSRKERIAPVQAERTKEGFATGVLDDVANDDLASRMAEEVRKQREEATANNKGARLGRQQQGNNLRSRSKSASRQVSAGAERSVSGSKRVVSAPVDRDLGEIDHSTKFDFNLQSRNTAKRASLPSGAKPRAAVAARDEDSRDLTMLSWQDPNELLNLRKKLEEEFRARRENRSSHKTVEPEMTQQTNQTLPRKSSLKDVTAALDDGTGRFSVTGGHQEAFAKIAKSVRVQSPHTSDATIEPQQPQSTEQVDISLLSNTSRRRRRAASVEGMTSAFILPDITLSANQTAHHRSISHDAANCTACPPTSNLIRIPTPVPVTDRELDADITSATIRPAQPPAEALATVIKQLEDEIKHLKIQLAAQQRLYNQHDPALSKRRRMDVKSLMERLTQEIEKRSDQVYALYDVVEGQKKTSIRTGKKVHEMTQQEVEETLSEIGIDPAELSGRIGRKNPMPFGLGGADDMSDHGSVEIPWEGFSDIGSEEEMGFPREERRKSGVY